MSRLDYLLNAVFEEEYMSEAKTRTATPEEFVEFANGFTKALLTPLSINTNLPDKDLIKKYAQKYSKTFNDEWETYVKDMESEGEQVADEDRMEMIEQMFFDTVNKQMDFFSVHTDLRIDKKEYFEEHPDVEASDVTESFVYAEEMIEALINRGKSMFDIPVVHRDLPKTIQSYAKSSPDGYVGKDPNFRDGLAQYAGLLLAAATFLK